MFSFFNILLDKLIIRMACAAQAKPGTYEPCAREAALLLQEPDLFERIPVAPADFQWVGENGFTFSSAIVSPWPQNQTVYGKLFRAAKEWQSQPTVILVHGWNDELGYAWRHPYQAKHFVRHGLNVAMLELPYHMQRRPRAGGAVNDFLSEDLRCTVMAAQQAVSDIRVLLAWLHAQGCTRTGLLGVSLGGWLSGLVASHDERVQFLVMNVPVVSMARAVQELPFCEPIRRSIQTAGLQNQPLHFERMNLRSYQPKTARDDILIIEAVDDLFACKEAIEELWQTWNEPEIWRVHHAHISGLFSPSLLKRQVAWVAAKALQSDARLKV